MRRTRIETPVGGWFAPWPLVFELVDAAQNRIVLIGGLMTQLHAMIADIGDVRTTEDVDLLVNIMDVGSTAGVWHGNLLSAGFVLAAPSVRYAPSHRYRRGTSIVDLVVPEGTVPAPRLGRRLVMQVDGGRQALGKLMEVEFNVDGRRLILQTPDELGALILKAAAHKADPRDKPRHLRDAALLASLIDDPIAERDRLVGSDHNRLRYIAEKLADPFDEAWQLLPSSRQQSGQDALRIMAG